MPAEIDVIARFVVVAPVPVAFVKVNVERVDDAGAKKPCKNARVVEVDCSFVPSLVNGNANELIEFKVPLVRFRFDPIINGTIAPLGDAYGI